MAPRRTRRGVAPQQIHGTQPVRRPWPPSDGETIYDAPHPAQTLDELMRQQAADAAKPDDPALPPAVAPPAYWDQDAPRTGESNVATLDDALDLVTELREEADGVRPLDKSLYTTLTIRMRYWAGIGVSFVNNDATLSMDHYTGPDTIYPVFLLHRDYLPVGFPGLDVRRNQALGGKPQALNIYTSRLAARYGQGSTGEFSNYQYRFYAVADPEHPTPMPDSDWGDLDHNYTWWVLRHKLDFSHEAAESAKVVAGSIWSWLRWVLLAIVLFGGAALLAAILWKLF